MQLIGMLDSPYVRRVAISLRLLGLRFEHRSISVSRTFVQFQQINRVVKAPPHDKTAVIGPEAVARPQIIKKLWDYINLQDAANQRAINADAKLLPVFGKP